MLRTRTRTSGSETIPWSIDVVQGPHWTYLASAAMRPVAQSGSFVATDDIVETIIDEDDGWEQENSCIHYVREVIRDKEPLYGWCTSINPANQSRNIAFTVRSNYRSVTGSYGNVSDPVLNSYPIASMASWQVPNLSARALRAMWPEIETELSSLNSLYELKDFRSLPSLAHNIREGFKKLPKMFMKQRRKALRSIAGLSSESYLTDKFAIRPLLSDIVALHQVWNGAQKQLQKLLEKEGETLRRHYKTELSPSDIGYTGSIDGFTGPGGNYLDRRYIGTTMSHPVYGPPVYHASMTYSYRLPHMTRQQAARGAYLDSLGIQVNPAIIWNAIPWSFVVDWFLKIGNFLEQFKARNVEPRVSVESFVHSARFSLENYCYVAPYTDMVGTGTYKELGGFAPTVTLHNPVRRKCFAIRKSYYIRRPYLPNFFESIQLSGYSKSEFLLSLALFGARRPNHYRNG